MSAKRRVQLLGRGLKNPANDEILKAVLVRTSAHPRLATILGRLAAWGLHGNDALEALVRLAEIELRNVARVQPEILR